LVYAAGQQLSGFKIDGAAPVATGGQCWPI